MWDWEVGVVGGVVLLIIAGVTFMAVRSEREDDRQRAAACARMWELARTNADSISIIQKCEYPKEQEVVPVFIPYSTGAR